MIAKFTTKLKDGTPTHFVPKILLGYYAAGLITNEEHDQLLAEAQAAGVAEKVIPDNIRPKLHTMREDKSERWHTGLMFQPATGPMYGPKFKFAPAVPVLNVVPVHLRWVQGKGARGIFIKVDGWTLGTVETSAFIRNDGFDTVADFLDWFFPKPEPVNEWRGRLIQYAPRKYPLLNVLDRKTSKP